jgi:hypothetical protein
VIFRVAPIKRLYIFVIDKPEFIALFQVFQAQCLVFAHCMILSARVNIAIQNSANDIAANASFGCGLMLRKNSENIVIAFRVMDARRNFGVIQRPPICNLLVGPFIDAGAAKIVLAVKANVIVKNRAFAPLAAKKDHVLDPAHHAASVCASAGASIFSIR